MEPAIFVVVNFLIVLVPLIVSLYRETRFTGRWSILVYGLGSILFGLLYFSDPSISAEIFVESKNIALPLFLVYGIMAVLVSIAIFKRDIREGWWTLTFSGKYFAAFQIPFLYTQLVALPPKISETVEVAGVLQWGIVLSMIFIAANVAILAIKNHIRFPMLRR